MSGTIICDPAKTKADLSLDAANLPITRELLSARPAEIAALVDQFSEGGKCDIRLDRLQLTSPPANLKPPAATSQPSSGPSSAPASAAANWNASGSVTLKDAVINLDFGAARATGSISGAAGHGNSGLDINARIELDSLDLPQRRLKDVGGRLVKAERSSMIRIEDLAAKVHGGRVAGFAEIRLSSPPQYGLSLSVEDVHLDEMFKFSRDPNAKDDVTGLLTGNIQMTGLAGDPASRQASGVLRISKGRLYKLPIIMGFIHVIYLWLPGQNAFTEGDVSYRLQGEKLLFDEIYLHGPAVSLVGSGRMNMNNEALILTFLTGPPGRMPRLANLDELLKGLWREIVEIRVIGTLDKPIPQTISLPGFNEAMRRLLSPDEEKEPKGE